MKHENPCGGILPRTEARQEASEFEARGRVRVEGSACLVVPVSRRR